METRMLRIMNELHTYICSLYNIKLTEKYNKSLEENVKYNIA